MAAPTITRTGMVDDDGTGEVGTVINNAWKQELYDQIDALGIAQAATPLIAANGMFTGGPGLVDLSELFLPVLTVNDRLFVTASFINVGTGIVDVDIAMWDPARVVRAMIFGGPTGAGDLVAGGGLSAHMIIMPAQDHQSTFSLATGLVSPAGGSGQSRGFSYGAWNLVDCTLGPPATHMNLRHVSGQAGGPLYWNWTVHLLKG